MVIQGSNKVPFGSPRQVDVLAGQVTLKGKLSVKTKETILDFQNRSCQLNSSY